MKVTQTKITTTTTTVSGTKVRTQNQSSSQSRSQVQSKPKSSTQFSIMKSFTSQKPSQGFKDSLFEPSDDSLYSSKQEVQEYQMQKIPKFLLEKKRSFYPNLPYHKKKVATVGLNLVRYWILLN